MNEKDLKRHQSTKMHTEKVCHVHQRYKERHQLPKMHSEKCHMDQRDQ